MNNTHGHNMHGHSMPSMKKAEFKVSLKSKKQIAEGTMAFTFEKPKGFHFKAGQHVRMTLINPLATDDKGNSRFLSLASTPQDRDLMIALRMGNSAFKRVLGGMKIGEEVSMQILLDVPHGAFALHDDASKPAVFLVGGIGIVPAYSMIKDATERKLTHKIFLFYSNRRPEDAPFLGELEQLTKQNPNFKLIATMTEPEKSAKPWQGETGHINHSMITRYLDDLQSPIYYITGFTEMVDAMKILLKNSGVNENNIQAEEFSGFDLNKINSTPSNVWKRYFLPIAVVLMIITGIIFHAGLATSIFNAGLGAIVGSLFILVIFKIFVMVKFKHLLNFSHGKRNNHN